MASITDMLSAKVAEQTQRPASGLNDLVICVYGDKKVGKSTFATRFDKPLFFDFEDALRTVVGPSGERPDQVPILKWDDPNDIGSSIRGWVRELQKPEVRAALPYRTLVLDGLGQMYKRLVEHILVKHGVPDVNDGALAYGKGGRVIRKELEDFFLELRALSRTGMGIVLLAHDRIVPFTHNNVEFDKRVPLIDGEKDEKAWTTIRPTVDLVVYAYKQNTQDGPVHYMQCKGTELVEAADPTPDGRLPFVHFFSYPELKAFYDGTHPSQVDSVPSVVEAAENGVQVPQTEGVHEPVEASS